ncbi:MAG: LCP family protein [Oscillospiraceae bacterium]|nr:LCP family protein [Oscillospiraceae bacterium]
MAGYYGKRGEKPAAARKNSENKGDFIDISSKSSVKSVYNKKNKVTRIVSMVMAIVFILAGCGLCYASSLFSSLGDDGTLDKLGKDYKVTDDDAGEGVVTDSKLLENADVLNVMLFGEDKKATAESTGRSDTMILVSLDVKHKQLKLTSFLRDTYVYIPSGDDYAGWNKLNASYSLGGAKLAVKTIESNFGVKIDRYGVIDFSGFKEVIDAMGGVKIKITGSEARYINAQIDHNNQSCRHVAEKYCVSEYKTDKDGNPIYNRFGEQAEKTKAVKLNGQQALWYARNRGSDEIGAEIFAGDDWDRTERQRKLLMAVVSNFKKASFTDLVKVVNSIGPMITTNFKENDITSLMTSVLTFLNYPMYQFHIPIGESADVNKLWTYDDNTPAGSVVRITDWDKTRKQLANYVFKMADKKYRTKSD